LRRRTIREIRGNLAENQGKIKKNGKKGVAQRTSGVLLAPVHRQDWGKNTKEEKARKQNTLVQGDKKK